MAPFCMCSTVPGLVYACSGAGELGELADRAARQLGLNHTVLMGSLASIGAGSSGHLATAEAATRILVIDGCDRDCGRRCLARAGLGPLVHLRVSEVEGSGERPDTSDASVERLVQAARGLLLGRL